MTDPRTLRFWRLALQSGLMDAQNLSDCWKAIPPERRQSLESIDRRLAREAIQRNLLTLWQAQQLLAGRFNGFAVGRYTLQNLIGQGGMGRVYLAKDTRLDRIVALKILSADRMKNPRAIARFQREARVGAQLQHENLVRIYDFGESDTRHYLVMEYIEGRTVGALIAQQGPLPPAVAAGLGRQVALGLDHAYKKGLIHRDVNPYNILVTFDGVAKLADMGLARELADNDRFTREGATVGTFDYVAPEQARQSHSADIRSDIYSLGCTLYHMISGDVPFPTESLPEKIYAHQTQDPIPLEQRVPDIPKGLALGISRMMKKLPDDRYANPLQVAQMLEPYLTAAIAIVPRDDSVPASGRRRGGPEAETLMIQVEAARPINQAAAELNPPTERVTSDVMVVWHGTEHSGTQVPAPTQESVSSDAETATNPSSPVPPSIGAVYASDPDLALVVDLGPEPSLSELLAESRSLSRSRATPGSFSGVWGKERLLTLWQRVAARRGALIAVGLAAAVVISAVLLASRSMRFAPEFAPASTTLKTPAKELPKRETQQHARTASVSATANTNAVFAPIVVQPFDGNGPDVPAKNLADAISRAIGSRGVVVLRGRAPIELGNETTIQANLEGNLTIRSEMEKDGVLVVSLKRSAPLLRTGSQVTVVLDGLNLDVRASDTSLTSASVKSWSLIQAAGPLTVRRSAIRFSRGSVSAPSFGAILSDGGSLTIEQSRFEGFDRAIEIRSYGKQMSAIRQSIITTDGATGTRAIDVAQLPTRGTKPVSGHLSLTLDCCTVEASSLFQVAGISERTPFQVELLENRFRGDTLVAWNAQGENPSWSRQVLPWAGRGNRLEIGNPSWIAPVEVARSPEKSITERDSWLRQVKETAKNSLPTAGADPRQVGPTSPAPL